MIGPRHTLRSVARDLAQGLEDGRVLLGVPSFPISAYGDLDDVFARFIKPDLERYERLDRILMNLRLALAFVWLTLVGFLIWPGFANPWLGGWLSVDTSSPAFTSGATIGSVIAFGLLICLEVLGLKTRERLAELVTLNRTLLEIADRKTAERLIARLEPRLWERSQGEAETSAR